MANLGRRNQNLVRRQLRLISELEQDEADPTVLANLFELDHLATRMRRNAESLLVLTDEESPRRWAGPMPVADVIRSAIAEVEDYRRVVLRRTEDILIVGSVVAGLAHLLAELIENALSFSPPDQDVEIYARSDGGSCLIAVVDHGMGMSAEELASANERLAGGERPPVAPTRFLGHNVVARLAERLGVRVHLHESPLTGITAKVTLPPELVAPPGGAESGGSLTGPGADAEPGPASRDGGEPIRAPVPALAPPPPAELSARAQRLLRRPPPRSRPADPPPASAAGLGAPATTRNGLIKRVPRRQRDRPAGTGAMKPAPADQPPSTARPEEVGGRLATLRAAVRRAEAAEAAAENDQTDQTGARAPSDDEG